MASAMPNIETVDAANTDICMSVGFSSLGTFSRTFRDIVGQSPKKYRAAHLLVAMVPTQMHRLMALPEPVRAEYDVSSLRQLIHAAAPCPIELKRRMFEWLGPVIYEF